MYTKVGKKHVYPIKPTHLAYRFTTPTTFTIMAYLQAPMTADTVWTITFLCASWMIKRHHAVFAFLGAHPTNTYTTVTTSENIGAWLSTTEILRRNINEAGESENMATLGNNLVNFEVTLDRL